MSTSERNALQESERRYKRLLASTTDYIYSVKIEAGQAVATSHGPGCQAVTGYSSEEFSSDPWLWYRVIHEADRPTVIEQVQRIMRGETTPLLEHRILHQDGRIRWISNKIVARRNGPGQLTGYDGLISDITPRKQAEQLLAVQCAVTQGLSAAHTLPAALAAVLKTVGQSVHWDEAVFWSVDAAANTLRCTEVWHSTPAGAAAFESTTREASFGPGAGLPGQVWQTGEPAWVPDVTSDTGAPRTEIALQAGRRSACAFPIRRDGSVLGVIELFSREPKLPDRYMLEVLAAVGTQLGQFMERHRAETTLASERNLLRTLLDNLPDYIYVKDTESRFVLSNAAHVRALGATGFQEAVGKDDTHFFPRKLAEQYRADEEMVMRSGQPLLNREELVIDAAGRHRWVLATKVPLKDAAGKTVGLVGVSRDITERKQAEKALQLSQERLALVIEGSNDGIWDWDIPTNKVYFSPRWKSMLGYADDEVENTFSSWQRLMHPADLPRAMAAIENYWSHDVQTYELEHRLRHRDGSYRWVLARGVARRDDQGRPVRMAGSHVDLTERKLAEEALTRSEHRFRTLATLAPVGIFEGDAEGRCIYVNDRGCELTGLSIQECLGQRWTRAVHPADRDAVVAAAGQQARGAGHFSVECRLRRPNGQLCWVVGRAIGLRDEQGGNRGFICTVMDITERKLAEERLTQAYAELAQSDVALKQTLGELKRSHEELKTTQLQLIQAAKLESIGTLAAGVAHEVKNPLQSILLGLDYLSQALPKTDAGIPSVLTDMREAVGRANAIILELLHFSAATEFETRDEDLNEVAERSLRLMNPELGAARIEVVREFAPDPPRVRLDRGKMEQVFINVILNALQAMPEGGTLTVAIRHARAGTDPFPRPRPGGGFQPGDPVVLVQVRDTGGGIAPEILPRLFDPFFTTKPVGVGTGLGLSVVRRILDLHEGAVEIANAPGGGALVTIALQASPAVPMIFHQ